MRFAGATTWWRVRPSYRLELAAATAAAAASLTPSLLPKTVLVQGLVTGIAATVGYGLGALGRQVSTPVRRRLRRTAWKHAAWVLLAASGLWLVASAVVGRVWQRELSAAIGQRPPPATDAIASLLLAGALLAAVVLVARGIRVAVRWAAGRVFRALPRGLALTLAAVIVGTLTTTVVHSVVRHGVLGSADESFRLVNQEASPDLPVPSDPLRSGGPGSLVDWSALGHAGREFVSLPPPEGQPPVRVYAGIDSAEDLSARADLVVAELDRTDGWSRGVLCVVVPTGTGWVDPAAVRALERLWAGDTAIVSMQYSYLPSALSVLMDQLRVDDAGRALVDAVVRAWHRLPADRRPKLVVYGESLGSRGAEVAMRDVPGAAEAVSGVLLVGPMNSNPTWRDLVSRRDPGSPLLAPVVDGGRAVRFWPGAELPGFDRTGQPWPAPPSGPRTLYLQHPSDPIVWWSPSLLWSEPGWVDERTVLTRAPPLRWRPIVTFWQVAGDAAVSNEVPVGHGHRYGAELPAAWAAVAPRPEGATTPVP